jgi:hypothetical protein
MRDADRSGRPWRLPRSAAVAVPALILGLVAVLPTLTLLGTDPCVEESPTDCSSARRPVLGGGAGEQPSSVPAPDPGAMPRSRPGWRVTFADDFTGPGLDRRRWGRYEGRPGGAPPTAVWAPDNVVVRDGKLVLKGRKVGARWVTAGVSMAHAGSQTYGRWDIRFRVQRGNGVGYAVLLYPGDGGWPPEIDIAEDGGGGRGHTQATLHWSIANHQLHRDVAADFTRWHTVSVIWQPGRLHYLLDDREWGRVESPDVPDEPMWLGLQTQQATCTARYRNCPDTREAPAVDLEVDWVVRWKAAPLDDPSDHRTDRTDPALTGGENSSEERGPVSAERSGGISAEGLMRRPVPGGVGWT